MSSSAAPPGTIEISDTLFQSRQTKERADENDDEKHILIDKLKSECLELCSEILTELDTDILPPKKQILMTKEDPTPSNQATVRFRSKTPDFYNQNSSSR